MLKWIQTENDRVMVVCAVWWHQRRLSGIGVVHDHDAEDVPHRPGHSACGQPHPQQHRHLLPEVSGFFLLTAHCGRLAFLMRQVVVGHQIERELGSVLTRGHSHWALSQMVMRSKARLDCRPLLLSGSANWDTDENLGMMTVMMTTVMMMTGMMVPA